MNTRIQLDDLIGDAPAYEPHLMRVDINAFKNPDDDAAIAHAAAKTATDILKRSGAPSVEITDEDAEEAEILFKQHVRKVPMQMQRVQKTATALKLEALVSEYDYRVIQHADQIRYLVTNKLLELSDHRDPKVQLKAVELLGKLADVGMFVEKQEITLKQTSDDELKQKLSEKLGLLIEGEIVQDTIKTHEELKTAPDAAPLASTPQITTDTIAFAFNL